MGIRGRHGGNCGGGVVACDGDHGHLPDAGFVGDFLLQNSNFCSRLHYLGQDVRVDAQSLKEGLLELAGVLVHHAGGGSIGVLAYHLTGEHVGQQVRHEQDLVCLEQGLVSGLLLRIELEDGVEVHDLDASDAVEFIARDDAEHLFGDALGVGVTVGPGPLEQLAVGSDGTEIDAPGVYTDGFDLVAKLGCALQAGLQVAEKLVGVPVETPALFLGPVGEAMDLFHREFTVLETAHDGASAGGAKVESEKFVICVHSLLIMQFSKLSIPNCFLTLQCDHKTLRNDLYSFEISRRKSFRS